MLHRTSETTEHFGRQTSDRLFCEHCKSPGRRVAIYIKCETLSAQQFLRKYSLYSISTLAAYRIRHRGTRRGAARSGHMCDGTDASENVGRALRGRPSVRTVQYRLRRRFRNFLLSDVGFWLVGFWLGEYPALHRAHRRSFHGVLALGWPLSFWSRHEGRRPPVRRLNGRFPSSAFLLPCALLRKSSCVSCRAFLGRNPTFISGLSSTRLRIKHRERVDVHTRLTAANAATLPEADVISVPPSSVPSQGFSRLRSPSPRRIHRRSQPTRT
jgi:hypothetical protein